MIINSQDKDISKPCMIIAALGKVSIKNYIRRE